jgi:hypothetical protein
MIHGELFELGLRYGSTVPGAGSSISGTRIDPSIHVTTNSTSAAVLNVKTDVDGDFTAGATNLILNSISGTTAVDGYVAVSSQSPFVGIEILNQDSLSGTVTVTVTPFLDNDGIPGLTNGDSVGEAYTIQFVPWSTMGASLTVGQPIANSFGATASFTVTQGTIRWGQLDGSFGVAVSDTAATSTGNSGTISASLTGTPVVVSASTLISGAYSLSAAVITGQHTTSTVVSSISATLVYFATVPANTANVTEARGLAAGTSAVTAVTIFGTALSFSATSENIRRTNTSTADARFNSTFTLDAYPYNEASVTTSVLVATAFTVSAVGAGMEMDADSGVILDGVTYTTSAALLGAGFTLAAGDNTVQVTTFGQSFTGASDSIAFDLTAQGVPSTLTITLKQTSQTVAFAQTAVAGLAGASRTFAVTALDQWGVASVRTDQRIAGSVKLGAVTTATLSGAVVNGGASITLAPPTGTGSAVVAFTLQTFAQASQQWENDALSTNDYATWNLYSYTAGSDSITSRTVSKSASISYGVALSWSETIAVVIANSFSDVVASAPGLMIQNADSVTVTASDVLTIAANGKTANFKFTSRLAGTYTVTFTNGTATTTSTIIVDVAGHDSGATLTFDKASIAAGTTTTVIGTLKDVNGNPVMTSGSSDVSVAWTGKGLPFGNATNMETDAAGQLTFYVLVLSGEVGDAAISATYKPAGLAVSTKNVTVVHAVAVGKAAATSADQKITIGTYKGYVGVFTKGYEGQKLSVRLASKWHVRNPIEDLKAGYSLLTVNTGVGYVANVIVYIDGVEVKRETITTK